MSVLPIYCTEKITMCQSLAFPVYSQILQNTIAKSSFVSDASKTFSSKDVFSRHKELCTRDDFVSVLHVLPTPDSKQTQIKLNQYKYCTKAPFVIYEYFKCILEQSGRLVKQTTYTQKHKVCAAAAILT